MMVGGFKRKIVVKSSSLHRWYDISKNEDISSKYEKFAFWFAFAFILNGYASGISGLSLGSVIFVAMSLLSLNKLSVINTYWSTLIFAFFAISVSLIGFMLNGMPYFTPKSMVVNIAKLLLWAIMSSVISEKYYKFEKIYKWLKIFAYVMLIYLVFQDIAFYGFHKYLPNIFDFFVLKPYDAGYADATDYLTVSLIIRPAGFLSESAFLGNYLLCVLAMAFKDLCNRKSGNISDILIISIGIILSSSTSAVVCMPILWIVYWKKMCRLAKIKVLIVCTAVIMAMALLVMMSVIRNSNFVYSFQYMFDKFSRISQNTRIGKSFSYMKKVSPSILFFGVGYGNYMTYLQELYGTTDYIYVNGVVGLIIQIGVIGLLEFGVFCFKLIYEGIKYKSDMVISLMLVYLLKGFSSGIFFSTYGIMFMFIINGELNINRREREIV